MISRCIRTMSQRLVWSLYSKQPTRNHKENPAVGIKIIIFKKVLFSFQILLICSPDLIKFQSTNITEALTICFFKKVDVFKKSNVVFVWGQLETNKNKLEKNIVKQLRYITDR